MSGLVSSEDQGAVKFQVTTSSSTTRVALSTDASQCQEFVVTMTDREHASFSWDGVAFTGKGALRTEQVAALAALKNSIYVSALVTIPLELGCHPDLDPALVGAVVFPLQVLLKYDPTPNTRAAGLEALGRASRCGYFGERKDLTLSATVDGEARMGALQFAPSEIIPAVFGYDLLDGAGASEPTDGPAKGQR